MQHTADSMRLGFIIYVFVHAYVWLSLNQHPLNKIMRVVDPQ